jgi:hypothetical protein
MPRRRPAIVLVAAVISIVWGALGSLCGVLMVAGLVFNRLAASGAAPQDPTVAALRQVPYYEFVETTTVVLVPVLSFVLLAAGIGLLKVQPWARRTALAYAAVTIVLWVANVAYRVGYLLPAAEKLWMEGTGGTANPTLVAGYRAGLLATVGLQAAFFLVHALFLVIVLRLPLVAAAFTDQPTPSGG